MDTHIFWNCDLCSFSSLIVLSVVIWQIVSQIVVSAEIVIQTEHGSIVAAKVAVECIVAAAQVWAVAHAIEAVHQAVGAVCAVGIVEIIESAAHAKAIVSELVEIWSIEVVCHR